MTALRGVLFDLDGTIVDVPYDWDRIRHAVGTRPGGATILAHIEAQAEPERSRLRALLEGFEDEATRAARLKPGIRALLADLTRRRILTALVTNNSRANLERLLGRFQLTFDYASSRENGLWKPSGAPIRAAMSALGLSPGQCCAVGDSPFDVRAAEEAGVERVFILDRDPARFAGTAAEVLPSVAALRRRIASLP
jgi:HAD superfamily hydrolase (TIGR01509 family)